MSPLLGRLRDWFTPVPAAEGHDEAEAAEGQRRRRRGRRGGRGRRRGAEQSGAANQATPPTHQTAAQAPRPERQTTERNTQATTRTNTDRRERDNRAGDERREDDRYRRGRRDGRRPQRRLLEAPLPEDVAFRPPSEGGDRTILPTRRRPPPGLRATQRVLLAGSRLVPRSGGAAPTTEDPRSQPPPEERPARNAPANASPARPDPRPADHSDGEADGAGATRKRRRGKRGGRRRRGGASGEAADPAGSGSPQAPANGAHPPLDGAGDSEDAADLEHSADYEESPAPRGRTPRRPAGASGALPPAFAALGAGETSLNVLTDFGFSDPTPIQERAIPLLLAGGDVVGVAQTGSGKTLAFGIPLVERCDPALVEPQALVLVPTRELAQQVLEVMTDLARPFGLRCVGLLGGRALNRDFAALERGTHVVVGTPGRVIDHLRRGTLSLRSVHYAVLDEADEMLDIGFLPDITRILSRTPRRRQTALFSATMPMTIKRLVHRYMRDPATVSVDPELTTVESVEQIYFEVAERDKQRGLSELVRRELKGRTLVFSKTRRGADRLSDRLSADGIRVGALHGDMDQRRRDRVVERFRAGELDILVATNVAARGIDIPEITHVVNFDVPQNAEEYVHRIGRTGRMGREGKAITFVSERDLGDFDTLLRTFGDRLHKERLELYD